MTYIWYNPEIKAYQMGSLSIYKSIKNNSIERDEFSLFYKFESTQSNLAKKIFSRLNITNEENITD